VSTYTPTVMVKGSSTKIAGTIVEFYQLQYQGYTPVASPSKAFPSQPPYNPRDHLTGSPSTDITSVSTGVALDGALNNSYQVTNPVTSAWPVDAYGNMGVVNSAFLSTTSKGDANLVTHRFMTDAPKVMLFSYGTGWNVDLFVDGKPYGSNPIALTTTAAYGILGLWTITFPNDNTRLVEIRLTAGLISMFCAKPYRIWKPAPESSPKIAVVGDSYVYPSVMSNTAAGGVSTGAFDLGIWQQMAPRLGLTSMTFDGVGGSGYTVPGSSVPYADAARIAHLQKVNPDVIIIHGGGHNDFYYNKTVTETAAGAIAYFIKLRTLFPNAKLVFVEGMSNPTIASHNADFVALRKAVQAGLAGVIRGMYFIDVATSGPQVSGTGHVTAANSSGNSDIYVGSDAIHMTQKGNAFMTRYLSGKIRRILFDNGALDGTLI
jgi:hypothetical protein